jgi:hypothetical protein
MQIRQDSVTDSPSPSLRISATPPRGFACWQNIAVAFESWTQAKKLVCSGAEKFANARIFCGHA